MAIKVTLGEAQTQEEKPFPKLMISKVTGNIVLFHSNKKGTVVFLGENNGTYCLGEYRDDLNIGNFTDYNEQITLQNK